jgi:hypothetical protein
VTAGVQAGPPGFVARKRPVPPLQCRSSGSIETAGSQQMPVCRNNFNANAGNRMPLKART